MYLPPDIFCDREAAFVTFVYKGAYDVTFGFQSMIREKALAPTKNATSAMFVVILATFLMTTISSGLSEVTLFV